MVIEEKLDYLESVFRTTVERFPESIDYIYEKYMDYYNEHQDYIWYHNVEPQGFNYVNETYKKLRGLK